MDRYIHMELPEKTTAAAATGSREALFETLYERAFPPFARFAARMNASFQDARDIFHDALVIFYEKSQDADFSIHTSEEAYVMGIAKHLWIRKFNRDRHHISLDLIESEISLPSDYFPAVDETRLLTYLEKSGKKCLELLRKFYFEKNDLRDIADLLGYRSEHSAAVQKYKCIGKMRDAIKTNAMGYEDFLI
jgi:RNA polymerase sigma factor (sigma-70 family)